MGKCLLATKTDPRQESGLLLQLTAFSGVCPQPFGRSVASHQAWARREAGVHSRPAQFISWLLDPS